MFGRWPVRGQGHKPAPVLQIDFTLASTPGGNIVLEGLLMRQRSDASRETCLLPVFLQGRRKRRNPHSVPVFRCQASSSSPAVCYIRDTAAQEAVPKVPAPSHQLDISWYLLALTEWDVNVNVDLGYTKGQKMKTWIELTIYRTQCNCARCHHQS